MVFVRWSTLGLREGLGLSVRTVQQRSAHRVGVPTRWAPSTWMPFWARASYEAVTVNVSVDVFTSNASEHVG